MNVAETEITTTIIADRWDCCNLLETNAIDGHTREIHHTYYSSNRLRGKGGEN